MDAFDGYEYVELWAISRTNLSNHWVTLSSGVRTAGASLKTLNHACEPMNQLPHKETRVHYRSGVTRGMWLPLAFGQYHPCKHKAMCEHAYHAPATHCVRSLARSYPCTHSVTTSLRLASQMLVLCARRSVTSHSHSHQPQLQQSAISHNCSNQTSAISCNHSHSLQSHLAATLISPYHFSPFPCVAPGPSRVQTLEAASIGACPVVMVVSVCLYPSALTKPNKKVFVW